MAYGVTETNCDFCDEVYLISDRWVAALRRPSDPTELVAVMWGCPTCGPEHGLLSAEAVDAIELGMTGEGPVVPGYEGLLFISV